MPLERIRWELLRRKGELIDIASMLIFTNVGRYEVVLSDDKFGRRKEFELSDLDFYDGVFTLRTTFDGCRIDIFPQSEADPVELCLIDENSPNQGG